MYIHFFKRMIDLVLSICAFPFWLLIFIPVAIAIKIDDGGPIFYSSSRVGKGFKKFGMYKFLPWKVHIKSV